MVALRSKYGNSGRFRVSFLALLWISCLIIGLIFSANDPSVFLLMRMAPKCNVSIMGLAATVILPVLFSIVGLACKKFVINYIILAVKAFLTGYVLYGILCCYGSAGWLVRTLMLFSDSSISILLLWLLFRHINGNRKCFPVDSVVVACAAVMIGIIDYLIVSPFLCSLLG